MENKGSSNTTAIQIFNNPEFGDVRIVDNNGGPWFIGKDVATALGYSNPRDALAKHVPDKFKRVSQIATSSGVQNMTLINEAGLYKLIMRSKLPNAEKFSDWACGEVLPSIRKTGSYSVKPMTAVEILHEMTGRMVEQEREQKRLAAEQDTIKESVFKVRRIA